MPDRRQIIAAGALGAAVVAGACWLAHLDLRTKISTDVLDLIPAGERTPELTLVRALADHAEARVMLFALTAADNRAPPPAVTRRFAETLAADPAFAEADDLADAAGRDALGRELYERRFDLLFPLWLHERGADYDRQHGDPAQFEPWLARTTAEHLGAFLASPAALAFQDLVPSDPLLLMPDAVERLRGGMNLLPHAAGARAAAGLVWARIAASPLRDEGQGPVFAAIDRATQAARVDAPGLTVAFTGVNRFAAASKARIQHEVSWLNLLSLGAVLAVALVFLRHLFRGLHLVPPILLAMLGAWTAVTLAFSPVHILVFVVGSLLTGVAIDYGFYIYLQAPADPGEGYWQKIRRLLEPLLASCFTTVAGFALLITSPLPLIRQLGVFVSAGLLCALGAAILYFSLLRRPHLESRPFRGGQALAPAARRRLRIALMLLWLVALPGLLRLQWNDDVRELEVPAPGLREADTQVRALFGENGRQTVWLTYGATLQDARDAWDAFAAWQRAQGSDPAAGLSPGLIIPTAAEHQRAVEFARTQVDFIPHLRAALDADGFDAAAFAPFFAAYGRFAATADDASLAGALSALRARLTGPASLLVHEGANLCWLVTIAPGPAPTGAPPPAARTVSASQLQSLNRVFARYRHSALRLSLVGLAIVGAGVFLTYGWRRGPRIFAIPCGACLGVFGLYGWLGLPLNLFHLLGAFLGVCLTHNYSIFTATSAQRREPPPMAVRLSAFTAMASFGVLALSGIPVVRALGGTVALMVLTALLAIEFEHFAAASGHTPPAPSP
ncbi:MAG TPA: MMPL family transporter [Opitutaceae bacterium]|nr:MMPL family transporter [Opitutaceae bacterium]